MSDSKVDGVKCTGRGGNAHRADAVRQPDVRKRAVVDDRIELVA